MRWKLWYHAREPVGGARWGDWMAAPFRGVLSVVHPDERVGRQIETGPFYFWPSRARYPWSADGWGVLDHLLELGVINEDTPLAEVPPSVLREHGIKLGRSVPNDEWREVNRRMLDDPEFPRKSAWEPHERR